MNYRLINQPMSFYSAVEQILANRGIPYTEVKHFLNTTDDDINSPLLFGEETLKKAKDIIENGYTNGKSFLVVVDADCDGYTSSAIIINYLRNIYPEININWYLHEGKQHGLNDCVNEALKYDIVICPDSSSNDYDFHKILKENGIDVIILDHHYAPEISKDAVTINNQLSDYPNKNLSGAGVTWQFCKYLDSLNGKNLADRYLDLVALGNTADVVSMREIETKHLVNKGFKPENVKNPYIYNMWQKNQFKLGDHITSMGAAFYIAPFVNAMVRSGQASEKELLFQAMLDEESGHVVPSTKRGHHFGDMETIVEQAIRVCNNVKTRQTKAQDVAMSKLLQEIEDKQLYNNKCIILTVDKGDLDANIAGLAANKIMGKYMRPCCVLTYNPDADVYQGSARGYNNIDFRTICEKFEYCDFAQGHAGAFGISIVGPYIEEFGEYLEDKLKDMNSEIVYPVDYIFTKGTLDNKTILDIGSLDSLWGKDMEEPYIALEDLQITKNMVQLMGKDTKPTLKIMLNDQLALIKFGATQAEYEALTSKSSVAINVVGRCSVNCYEGRVSPQVIIEDYEIIDTSKKAWSF